MEPVLSGRCLDDRQRIHEVSLVAMILLADKTFFRLTAV
jgi:hypothetical protein